MAVGNRENASKVADGHPFRARVLGLRRAASVLLALAAALALLLAGDGGASQAQTTQALVGNLGRLEVTANINLSADDAAQEFQTGGNETGYTLSSIDLNLVVTSQFPTVKVVSGSATGTEVATLTAPSLQSGRSNHTYTAPMGITLAKETSYWIVAEGGDGFWYRAMTTEDANPAAGWSIADNAQSRSEDSTGSSLPPGTPCLSASTARSIPVPSCW